MLTSLILLELNLLPTMMSSPQSPCVREFWESFGWLDPNTWMASKYYDKAKYTHYEVRVLLAEELLNDVFRRAELSEGVQTRSDAGPRVCKYVKSTSEAKRCTVPGCIKKTRWYCDCCRTETDHASVCAPHTGRSCWQTHVSYASANDKAHSPVKLEQTKRVQA